MPIPRGWGAFSAGSLPEPRRGRRGVAVLVLLIASDRLGPGAGARWAFLRRWSCADGRCGGAGRRPPVAAPGKSSEVETEFLRMRLDHDTGAMSGHGASAAPSPAAGSKSSPKPNCSRCGGNAGSARRNRRAADGEPISTGCGRTGATPPARRGGGRRAGAAGPADSHDARGGIRDPGIWRRAPMPPQIKEAHRKPDDEAPSRPWRLDLSRRQDQSGQGDPARRLTPPWRPREPAIMNYESLSRSDIRFARHCFGACPGPRDRRPAEFVNSALPRQRKEIFDGACVFARRSFRSGAWARAFSRPPRPCRRRCCRSSTSR